MRHQHELRAFVNLCDEHKHFVPVGGQFDPPGPVRDDIKVYCDYGDDSDEPGCLNAATNAFLLTVELTEGEVE